MEKEEIKSNEVKTEKPFYKKWWFIAIIIAVVLIGIVSINSKNKGEKIELTKTQLGHYLPDLPSRKGEIKYNTDKNLDIVLYNVAQDEYNNYKKKCEEKGFNIDISSSSSFEAFNEESYRLYMYTSEQTKMTISLSVPRELEKIAWPTSELANSLPIPEFDGGYINTDKSSEISITLGNISKEDYDKYVNECSAKGYNINYNKSNKNYKADNDKGNHLEVSYYGGRRINIHLKANSSDTSSSKTTSTTTETPKTQENQNNTTSSKTTTSTNSNGLSKEFKEAMDSYESFMNEYVEFMKKYQANSTDVALISQYATIMQKYSEQVSAFEKWDSKDMTTEEAKYYVDVQARVSKKLLEVTQ